MSPNGETVHLVEVFSSIQGEGLYVGCRQVFVRLAGCNILCRYCDTADSFTTPHAARIEEGAGTRNFQFLANPVPVKHLVAQVAALCSQPHHSVSLTGGEPLLRLEAVKALLTLRFHGIKLFLETNGTLPDALEQIIDDIDIVSLDFKLPSVLDGKEYWQEHEAFLRIAARREAYVKIVLSGETTRQEVARAIDLIAKVDPGVPLVFQPVTPLNGVTAVDPLQVLDWQLLALQRLKDVRVIPQTHKVMGQL